jgi:hypothetical protein
LAALLLIVLVWTRRAVCASHTHGDGTHRRASLPPQEQSRQRLRLLDDTRWRIEAGPSISKGGGVCRGVAAPQGGRMVKSTFLCQPCNRTWTYILSTEMAERYQPVPNQHLPIEAA